MNTVTDHDMRRRVRQILALLCVDEAPIDVLYDWFDGKSNQLQHWAVDHLRAELSYATGLSIIEAAVSIAISQVENGGEVFVDEANKKGWI